MSNTTSTRKTQRYTRSDRVAALIEGRHPLVTLLRSVLWQQHRGLLWLCSVVIVVIVGLVTHVWHAPFPYHLGEVPERNIDCVVPFSCNSPEELLKAQNRARTTVQHVYQHNPQPIIDLRHSLMSLLAAIMRPESFDVLDENGRTAWNDLTLKAFEKSSDPIGERATFDAVRKELANDPQLETTAQRVARVFELLERHGVLQELDFGPHEGSQDRVRIYTTGEQPEQAVVVRIGEILRDDSRIDAALKREFGEESPLVPFLSKWAVSHLVPTLHKDVSATASETQRVLSEVRPVTLQYGRGQTIAEAGKPLDAAKLQLLHVEYTKRIESLTWLHGAARFASFTTFFTLLLMLGWSVLLRWERRRPRAVRTLLVFHMSMLVTVLAMLACIEFSTTVRHLEILPLLIFAQWLSILYSWGFALIFTLILSSITVHTTNLPPSAVMVMACTALVVCIQIDRLRSRGRLITISLVGGVVAAILTLTLNLMEDQNLDWPLLQQAAFYFVWVVLSGFVMTGLLPFIESSLGVLTDMSLLDWGNGSHPLLQELIRRAPATYNHSVQVATIAETAVKAIGGRDLLTRVGAYFHDIGKVFKPECFIENQGSGENIHNTLEPRISTLVIVSHVKDGADLARQYNIPEAIVDFIEQHHGTSLVSYFYGVANRQNRESGASMPMEEGSFRYPGPKPQSKEAAVLMLADAAESACRSLDSASPHRIEHMVRQITKLKLEDGQLDESGLTLRDLHTVENSLIVSLIAIKHGRIKYPGQEKIESEPERQA
ncbi:MAG: HD family phosphohydrolase [Thermoguttaceae bacterium]